MWSVSVDGNRIVFGDPALRALLLFGWLAGFYILPEGLAARGPGILAGAAAAQAIGAPYGGEPGGPSRPVRGYWAGHELDGKVIA
jgi:hypothetical protein